MISSTRRHLLQTALRSTTRDAAPLTLTPTSISGAAAAVRALSSSSTTTPDLPRITERRATETGRGGRASDAGIKVAVFGATGFLGRYVCSGLGELVEVSCSCSG